MTHTPAPWSYRPATRAFVGWANHKGNYETIGHLSESHFVDDATRAANAALIVAAPDLLAALILCKDALDALGEQFSHERKMASAAIDLATSHYRSIHNPTLDT